MAEQSHRDAMNAAIKAQRERHAAPRSIAPAAPAEPEGKPEPPTPDSPRGLLRRLLGK